MNQSFTRRKFLQGGAVAATAAVGTRLFPTPAILADASPNSKLGTVVIGVANQRPEGPCRATFVEVADLEAALDVFTSPRRPPEKAAGDRGTQPFLV